MNHGIFHTIILEEFMRKKVRGIPLYKCYADALKINPDYELARNAFVRLTAMMN
ncbi:MAG: hypothetical protein MZV64_66025 [Ignavibacteriales bacterium]|nr:hypothetical protein [Ignavibacteriales bacterium]